MDLKSAEEEDPELIEMLRRETARRIDIEGLYLAEQQRCEQYRSEIAKIKNVRVDQHRFMIRRTRVSPKRSFRSSTSTSTTTTRPSDDTESHQRPVSPLRQTGMLRRSFIRVPPRLSSRNNMERRKR